MVADNQSGEHQGRIGEGGLPQRRAIRRAIGLVSLSLVIIALLVTDAAAAASNRWCAVYSRRGVENCTYATQQQCLAVVLGSDAWCRPNPFPGTAYGTGGSWSSGPPRQSR